MSDTTGQKLLDDFAADLLAKLKAIEAATEANEDTRHPQGVAVSCIDALVQVRGWYSKEGE